MKRNRKAAEYDGRMRRKSVAKYDGVRWRQQATEYTLKEVKKWT